MHLQLHTHSFLQLCGASPPPVSGYPVNEGELQLVQSTLCCVFVIHSFKDNEDNLFTEKIHDRIKPWRFYSLTKINKLYYIIFYLHNIIFIGFIHLFSVFERKNKMIFQTGNLIQTHTISSRLLDLHTLKHLILFTPILVCGAVSSTDHTSCE